MSLYTHARISSPRLLFLLCLLLLSVSLTPSSATVNEALQAGWSPTTNEVIANGKYNDSAFTKPFLSYQPFPTLYLWLSNASAPPVTYTVTTTNPLSAGYTALVDPVAWLDVLSATLTVYPLAAASGPVEQAALTSPGGYCNVDHSKPSVNSQLTLSTTADYDDVVVRFAHDCSYPRVNVGRAPDGRADVIANDADGYDGYPQLTPNDGVQLALTANTAAGLQLDLRVMGDEQWPAGQNASFVATLTASSQRLLDSTVVTPATGGAQQLTVSRPTLDYVHYTRFTLLSTCTDPADSGTVNLTLNFGFAQSYTVPVAVTCAAEQAGNPMPALAVDLLPTAVSSSVGVSKRVAIAVNGSLAAGSAFDVAAAAPFTFGVAQRYVALSVYSQYWPAGNVSAQLAVRATDDSFVGLSVSSASLTTTVAPAASANNALAFTLRAGRLNVLVETVCQTSLQQQRTTVVISGITVGATAYDDIEFAYQWTCSDPPLFALESLAPNAPGLLLQGGQPSNAAGGEWTVRGGEGGDVGGVVVRYDAKDQLQGVVGAALALTLQSTNATAFTWSLDRAASVGLDGATFFLNNRSIASGAEYATTLNLVAADASATLRFGGLTCMQREYVQVTTRLDYGWAQHVTLVFSRSCAQADPPLAPSAPPLSGAAVAGIVLAVLAAAGCVMGCGYRYTSKSKRGLAVIPFHDVWGAVQDKVAGPKRYAVGPQMSDADVLDLDGTTEDGIEISAVGGGYGATYQNDL